MNKYTLIVLLFFYFISNSQNRSKYSNEFLNIGGEEYLSSKNSYTLIEWADIIKDILPLDTIKIQLSRIKEDENLRKINVQGLNDGF